MNKAFSIKLPVLPNFLRLSVPGRDDVMVDIGLLSEAEVEDYIRFMGEGFRAHAAKRKEALAALEGAPHG